MWQRFFSTFAALSLLAACSGSGTDVAAEHKDDGLSGGALCESIGGEGASVEVADCVGCSVSSAEQLGDGRHSTAATLTTTSEAGAVMRLRVTAPEGVVRESFGAAGIVIKPIPRPHPEVVKVSVSTYLDGAPVQVLPTYFEFGTSNGCSLCTIREGDDQIFIGAPTVLPYNAVEVVLSIDGNVTGRKYTLFEVCGE